MISTKNYVLLLTNLHIAYSNRATVVVDAPAVLLDAVDALSVCADIVDVHHQYAVVGIDVDVVHIVSWTASVARSAKAFTTSDNITGMHVVFTPERSTDAAGNRVKQFLQGAKCEELPENRVEKDVQGGE